MKRIIILATILAFVFSGCQDEPDRDGHDPQERLAKITPIIEESAVPGKLFVKLNTEPADETNVIATRAGGTEISTGLVSLDDIAKEIGARDMYRVFPPAGKFEPRTRKAGLHLWYVVEFDQTITVTRAANELAHSEYIELIEPMFEIRPIDDGETITLDQLGMAMQAAPTSINSRFNDPEVYRQWHYNNDGSGNYWIAGADIRADGAWDLTTGHPDVIVAIVDGGIGYDHEDLAANMWINEAELNGATGVDDDGNGFVDDIYGYNFVARNGSIVGHHHGTHVAGTVAAVNNNGIGVAGVAGGDGTPNSGVRLMSCQIFHRDIRGSNSSAALNWTLAAIKYGADNGAVISQNSWGYEDSKNLPNAYLTVFTEAIEYFIKNAGIDENGNQTGPLKGGIVIFSAGNESSSDPHYPAALGGAIPVASFAPNYAPAYYTNYGPWVAISAPGGDLSYGNECAVYSTVSGYESGIYKNTYGYKQGTSMACPHVSGVVALYISKYGVGQPGLTPDMVINRMYETASPDFYNRYPGLIGQFGVGMIDAAAMLKQDGPEPVDPVLLKKLPQVTFTEMGAQRVFDLDEYFSDPLGGTLTYSHTNGSNSIVSSSLSENILTLTAAGNGVANIEVKATNADGLSISANMKIVCAAGIVIDPGNPGDDDDEHIIIGIPEF